jgi:hypothetical protein
MRSWLAFILVQGLQECGRPSKRSVRRRQQIGSAWFHEPASLAFEILSEQLNHANLF